MSEDFNLKSDRGDYEVLSGDFLVVTLHLLNEALRESGVEQKGKRREICRRFLESQTDFMDQGWFEGELPRHYPVLCFAKRGPWTDLAAGQLEELQVPRPTSFLYESYDAMLDAYFEELRETLGGVPGKAEDGAVQMGRT